MSQDKLSDRLRELQRKFIEAGTYHTDTEFGECIEQAEALERNRAEPVAHPDMTCGTCRRMLRWKDGQYHHHGPMMERHGVLVAEPWEEAGVVAAHPPKEAPPEPTEEELVKMLGGGQITIRPKEDAGPAPTDEELYKQAMYEVTPEALARMDAKAAAISPAPTARVLTNEEIDSLAKGWLVSIHGVTELWRTPAEFVKHLIKCGHISPKPQVSVEDDPYNIIVAIDELLKLKGEIREAISRYVGIDSRNISIEAQLLIP